MKGHSALVFSPYLGGHRQNYVAVIARWLTEAGYDVVIAGGPVAGDDPADLSVIREVVRKCSPRIERVPLLPISEQGAYVDAVRSLEEKFHPRWTVFPGADELRLPLSGLGNAVNAHVKRVGVFISYIGCYRPIVRDKGFLELLRALLRWRRIRILESRLLGTTSRTDLGIHTCVLTSRHAAALHARHKPLVLTEIYRPWGFEDGLPNDVEAAALDSIADYGSRFANAQWISYFGIVQIRRGFDWLVRLVCEDPARVLVLVGDQAQAEMISADALRMLSALEAEGRWLKVDVPFSALPLVAESAMGRATAIALPYSSFYGPSGSLIHAASLAKPCVVPNMGWIGRTMNEYGCGRTYCTGDYSSFRRSWDRLAAEPGPYLDGCARLAEDHSEARVMADLARIFSN